jgi:hypothetical protein
VKFNLILQATLPRGSFHLWKVELWSSGWPFDGGPQ